MTQEERQNNLKKLLKQARLEATPSQVLAEELDNIKTDVTNLNTKIDGVLPAMLELKDELKKKLDEELSYEIDAESIRGEKGEKGDTGESIVGPAGKDGYTPIKNVDYFDGIDGLDGRNGLDGKDADPLDPKEVIEEIKNLEGKEAEDFSKKIGAKIDISHVRNAQSFIFNNKKYKTEELMRGGGSSGTSSPLTTKGDIYTFDTTNARLPVGADGQILGADTTASTGLAWKNPQIPEYTSDPVAPNAQDAWVLATSTTSIVAGNPIGLLLSLTYATTMAAGFTYQLSYRTIENTTVRTTLS